MLITRKNARGGRNIKTFPLKTENGLMGYQIGYCANCNECLLLRTIDTQELLAHLFHSQKQYKDLIKKLEPNISFKIKLRDWLIRKLGGNVASLVENY